MQPLTVTGSGALASSLPMVRSCVPFSDWLIVRRHGERNDAHGLREGTSGGCAEGELQQPRQGRGVLAHGEKLFGLQAWRMWRCPSQICKCTCIKATLCTLYCSRAFPVEAKLQGPRPGLLLVPPFPPETRRPLPTPAPRPAPGTVSSLAGILPNDRWPLWS